MLGYSVNNVKLHYVPPWDHALQFYIVQPRTTYSSFELCTFTCIPVYHKDIQASMF